MQVSNNRTSFTALLTNKGQPTNTTKHIYVYLYININENMFLKSMVTWFINFYKNTNSDILNVL